MENFTPYLSLAGGVLIGISASILMYLNGRIAGISGIVAGVFNAPSFEEKAWRFAFVVGLVLGGAVYMHFFPITIAARESMSTILLIAGGLVVGIGTAMGSGCTRGHGICGISRFSLRSLVATATFLLSGIVTVYVFKQITGG
ncbi:YeeE/YedE family protein [Cycloclasticus sp. P1]|uniref:YeeE/YedE family protein n=1 Tax=Cycloclasticus sp. (strain P1) TaxID=385025 RepID=UPI000286A925|nr:YeeE/YedE thiosulfate transporter family protein [Cycloclasticus sp. P1]AFT66131.1 putative transporter component [Cycloclasticus sp. P1]